MAGQTVGNWRAPDDQTYDINVRLAPEARNNPEDMKLLPFTLGNNADGSPRIVRLNQVATVRESTGPNQINRRDLTREVARNLADLCNHTGGQHFRRHRPQPDQPPRPDARSVHQRQRLGPVGR